MVISGLRIRYKAQHFRDAQAQLVKGYQHQARQRPIHPRRSGWSPHFNNEISIVDAFAIRRSAGDAHMVEAALQAWHSALPCRAIDALDRC